MRPDLHRPPCRSRPMRPEYRAAPRRSRHCRVAARTSTPPCRQYPHASTPPRRKHRARLPPAWRSACGLSSSRRRIRKAQNADVGARVNCLPLPCQITPGLRSAAIRPPSKAQRLPKTRRCGHPTRASPADRARRGAEPRHGRRHPTGPSSRSRSVTIASRAAICGSPRRRRCR